MKNNFKPIVLNWDPAHLTDMGINILSSLISCFVCNNLVNIQLLDDNSKDTSFNYGNRVGLSFHKCDHQSTIMDYVRESLDYITEDISTGDIEILMVESENGDYVHFITFSNESSNSDLYGSLNIKNFNIDDAFQFVHDMLDSLGLFKEVSNAIETVQEKQVLKTDTVTSERITFKPKYR